MLIASFRNCSFFLTLVCWQSGAAWAQAPAADAGAEAKRLYREGLAAFHAGRLREAVDDFSRADRLVPSAALSFDAARVYEAMGQTGDALAAYREYLRRATDASNADAVRQKVAELEGVLASQGVQQLHVSSEPSGAELRIDDRALGVTPWTGQLTPGAHQLSLTKSGFGAAVREIQLEPLHATDLALTLTPATAPLGGDAPSASPPRPLLPRPERAAPAQRPALEPWAWATLGVGAGALLTAGGFELARRSSEHDAQQAGSQIDYASALESMHTRQTAARVLAVIGGAAVAGGGVLLAISWQHPRSQRPFGYHEARAPLRVALGCAPAACAGHFEVFFQ